MKMHRRSALSAAVTAFAVSGMVSAQNLQNNAAEGESVTLRMLPVRGTDQTQLLDKLSALIEPEVVRAGSAISIDQQLRTRCGFVSPQLLAAYATLNRQAGSVGSEWRRLPPCPYWTFDQVVKGVGGKSLDQVTAVNVGVAGAKTRDAVLSANAGKVSASGVITARQILMPVTTRAFTVRMKEGVKRSDVVEALEIFRTSGGSPALLDPDSSSDTSEFTLVAELTNAELAAAGDCSGTPAKGRWPYDAQAVLATLQSNLARGIARDGGNARIVIADTGISPDELSRAFGIAKEPPRTNDPWEYPLGANMAARGQVRPPYAFTDYYAWNHGTRVTGVLFSATPDEKLRAWLRKSIEVQAANIVTRQSFQPPIPNSEPVVSFSITPEGVDNSLKFAEKRQAHILNWSITSKSPYRALEESLGNARHLLTVAAAGNEGLPINRQGMARFPADYRRTIPSRIIVVGSHDFAGNPTRFTNRGSDVVDLLAPGCAVATFAPANTETGANGTSFSAPLVSLAAALLRAQGLSSPEEIRNRLFSTVRVDASLKTVVASAGTLDIEAALSFADDLVAVLPESGDAGTPLLRKGQIVFPDGVLHACGDKFVKGKVARIIPWLEKGTSKPMRLDTFTRNQLSSTMCEALDGNVAFRPLQQDGKYGTPELLPYSRIHAIVPAIRTAP